MKVYKWINLIMTALVAVLLVFVIVDSFFYQQAFDGGRGMDGIFGLSNGVWLVLLLSVFVVIQIICLFTVKPKLSVYRIGFYVLHIGLVLFLCGSFLYYAMGDMATVQTPVGEQNIYNQFYRTEDLEEGQMLSDGEILELPFSIGVSRMDVTYYDEETDGTSGVKWYDSELIINGSDGQERLGWAVNHPVRYGGWKFFLMGCNDTADVVVMQCKKDPGEFISLAGIWMIIGGSVLMCLIRKRKAGDEI